MTKPPDWFCLDAYRQAENLDAADWLLNLLFRIRDKQNDNQFINKVLRTAGPVLKRDCAELRKFFHRCRCSFRNLGAHVYVDGLMEDPPRVPSGIAPLTVEELYGFEGMLPESVRRVGREVGTRRFREATDPPAFYGRVDHAMEPQHTGRFVRVNLSLPDDVLFEDLKSFLSRERADLKQLPEPQPYQEAVNVVRKKKATQLKTLATIGLLPYLDLQDWLATSGKAMSDYELARVIEIPGNRLKETKRYARSAQDELALIAWLGPRVRGVPPRSKR